MKPNLLIGSVLALLSALVYAVQTAIVKHIGTEVSTPVLIFIQSIVCLVLILPLVFAKGRSVAWQTMRTSHLKVHFFRTVFSLGISYFLFYAVKSVPLVDAVLLANTAPLLIPIIGFIFMSRRINHKVWLPLLLGFIGIILVLRPDSQVFSSGALLALGAAVCMATSILLIGEAKRDSMLTRAFYYFLFSVPISGLGALLFWTPLSSQLLWVLIGIGVLFFIVQLSLVYALKYTHVQNVATLYLANILFAAIIDLLVWHTSMSIIAVLGMLLTLIGAVLTIRVQK